MFSLLELIFIINFILHCNCFDFLPSFDNKLKEDCPVDSVRVVKGMIMDQLEEELKKKIHIIDQDFNLRLLSRKFNNKWDAFDPLNETVKKYLPMTRSLKYRNLTWAVASNPDYYYGLYEYPSAWARTWIAPRMAQIHLESIEKDDIYRYIKATNLPDQTHFYHAMIFFEDETKLFQQAWNPNSKRISLIERPQHDFLEPPFMISIDQPAGNPYQFYKTVSDNFPHYFVPFNKSHGLAFFSDATYISGNLTEILSFQTSLFGERKPLKATQEIGNVIKEIFITKINALIYVKQIPKYHARFFVLDQDWNNCSVIFNQTFTGFGPVKITRQSYINQLMVDSIKSRKDIITVTSDSGDYYYAMVDGGPDANNIQIRNFHQIVINFGYDKWIDDIVDDATKDLDSEKEEGVMYAFYALTSTGLRFYQVTYSLHEKWRDPNDTTWYLNIYSRKNKEFTWAGPGWNWEIAWKHWGYGHFPNYIIWDFKDSYASVFEFHGYYTIRPLEIMDPFNITAGFSYPKHRPRIYSKHEVVEIIDSFGLKIIVTELILVVTIINILLDQVNILQIF